MEAMQANCNAPGIGCETPFCKGRRLCSAILVMSWWSCRRQLLDPLTHPPVMRPFPVDPPAARAFPEVGAPLQNAMRNAVADSSDRRLPEGLIANHAPREGANQPGQIEAADNLRGLATACRSAAANIHESRQSVSARRGPWSAKRASHGSKSPPVPGR